MKRMLLVVVVMVGCKGKAAEQPAPGSASAAPADAIPVIDAAPPDAPAAPMPSASTRNGPYGIDVKTKQTLAQLAAAGYHVEPNAATDRAPYMEAGFVANKADAEVGVIAHYAVEGDDKSIVFYETMTTTDTSPERPSQDALAAAGMCVDGVCPGAKLATAERLKITSCTAYTVESNWWFACKVPESPLVLVVKTPPDFRGARHTKPIAFAKLVAAKVEIDALAWGAWIPMVGCTTDCD